MNWLRNVFQTLDPYFYGSYVNYIDEELENWQDKYYGEHYEKLQKIKYQVDPNNFFNFKQSIEGKP